MRPSAGRSPAKFQCSPGSCGRNSFSAIGLLFLTSCSPREFLTRRLATDLISASDAFKTPQQFALQTGVVSNKDYVPPNIWSFSNVAGSPRRRLAALQPLLSLLAGMCC